MKLIRLTLTNMRPIKFRAWDKDRKRMFLPDWSLDNGILKILSNWEIMQFTGLLDKNGREIYEGDVIEHEVYDKPYSDRQKRWKIRKQVVWSKGFDHSEEEIKRNVILTENKSYFNQRPLFVAIKVNKKDQDGGYAWSEFHNCEVIGNIYENPELIKN